MPPTGAAFPPTAYRGEDFPYSAAAFNGDFDFKLTSIALTQQLDHLDTPDHDA
jgi:hypothetical protein